MKHVLLRLVCAAIIVATAAATAFGGGFQLNEHGARAMAQGGAWAARAYDLSSLYFNPAGLANLKGMAFSAGATLIIPKASYYNPSGVETKMIDQSFTPINFYGGYELMDGLAVGLGVNNPYGLGTEWPSGWEGRYTSIKVDLQSFFISPTVAYKISDELSVGGGLNIVTGNVKIKKAAHQPFQAVDPIVTLDMSATSVGFNVGAIYKVAPEVSVGASYRSSVKLDASGTASFDPSYSQINIVNDNVKSSLTLPATAFVGVSYKAMENLEVEADYQYIGWSSYKQLKVDFTNDPTKSTVADKNYQDTYIIRVGGEYTMGDVQLRAGYLYDHSPVKDQYVDPMLPDANRNGINFGAGYKIDKHWSVDVAYFLLLFNKRTVSGTVVSMDGSYQNIANLFGANVGYSF